jgi:hypothetical protein
MKQKLLTTAILSICLSIGLTAQTTGLTDDFSNKTNSEAVYTDGIGSFNTGGLIITKTLVNSQLEIDYNWVSNNDYNEISIVPPSAPFNLTATGQGLSFDYKSTKPYKITIGYINGGGVYTGYLVDTEGATSTFTVPASVNAAYNNVTRLQLIINTGGGQALDTSDADGTIEIDNLVIGDGSFQVKDGSTLGIFNNYEVLEAAIYPNPTTGIVNVTSKETILGYTVYSITGQLLLSKDLNTQGKDIQINLEEFSNGIYLLELSGENSKSIQKVILN